MEDKRENPALYLSEEKGKGLPAGRGRRLKIGIDIDGVLADIVEQMRPFLTRACGREISHDDINCYSFSQALSIPEEKVVAVIDEVVAGGHFGLAPVVAGAVEGLSRLAHHSLWLITSRPERVRDETITWLAKHGVPYNHLVFAPALDKARNGDGFDLFIEDNLEAALGLSYEGIPVLLFDWPWNRVAVLPHNVTRVHSWREVVAAVGELACA